MALPPASLKLDLESHLTRPTLPGSTGQGPQIITGALPLEKGDSSGDAVLLERWE